jgi:hypothetical protein
MVNGAAPSNSPTSIQPRLRQCNAVCGLPAGHAIIANEFIKTMNRSLRAGVPSVSIERVSKTDPLIFPESDHGTHTRHVSVGMADGLRVLRRR